MLNIQKFDRKLLFLKDEKVRFFNKNLKIRVVVPTRFELVIPSL